jgi:eukaryotic translation initiation factor 2-alpha kinase 4
MVLMFCQHVQTYLRDHNKPPTKSFYDEMLLNQQRNEQKEAQKHERRLELERKKQQKQVYFSLFLAT